MNETVDFKHTLPSPVIARPRLLPVIGRLLLVGLILWLLLMAASTAAPLRRSALSAVFLVNIFSSYLTDSRFEVSALFTPKPVVEERSMRFGEEQLRLTFCRPAGETRGGILLVNGAVELGNDEPAIRRVATSLARLGFVVGLPEMASFREFRIDPEDPARLATAFNALRAEPALHERPVGFAGLCFGASMALLAASDPAIANQVAFVAGAIPYARLDTYVVDVLSRSTVGAAPREWEPREDVEAKLPQALIEFLPHEADRQALRELIAVGQLDAGHPTLSPAGEALRRLLLARERAEIEALLAQQSPALQRSLARLSPLPQMERLRGPLFLFHSEDDRVIPWEHSAALAEAAPAGGRLEVSTLLHHTRLIMDPREWRLMLTYPREAWDLLMWLNELLDAAGVA